MLDHAVQATHNLHDGSPHPAVILGVTSPFLVLSTVLFLVQLYHRLKSLSVYRNVVGWDDFFLFLSVLTNLTAFTCTVIAITSGFNERLTSLTSGQLSAVILWITISRRVWIWSAAFIKMSLASTVIRAKVDPISRVIMSTFVVLIPVLTLSLWVPAVIRRERMHTAHDLDVLNALHATIAAIFFVGNLVLSLHPLLFLLTIRPLGEVLIASFLCFLGILAMVCSLLRLIFQLYIFNNPLPVSKVTTSTSYVLPFALPISLEVSFSIIAACTPTLFDVLRPLSSFLLPSSWRKRLAQSSYTLPKNQVYASKSGPTKSNPNFIYRWSRDLGLDALPDNKRMSRAPRPRSSWMNWRQSYIPRRVSPPHSPVPNMASHKASTTSFASASPHFATGALSRPHHPTPIPYLHRANSLPTPPASPPPWQFAQSLSRSATSFVHPNSPPEQRPYARKSSLHTLSSSSLSELHRSGSTPMWMQWGHEDGDEEYGTDNESVSVREFPRGILPNGGRVVSMAESYATSEEHLASRLVVRNV